MANRSLKLNFAIPLELILLNAIQRPQKWPRRRPWCGTKNVIYTRPLGTTAAPKVPPCNCAHPWARLSAAFIGARQRHRGSIPLRWPRGAALGQSPHRITRGFWLQRLHPRYGHITARIPALRPSGPPAAVQICSWQICRGSIRSSRRTLPV